LNVRILGEEIVENALFALLENREEAAFLGAYQGIAASREIGDHSGAVSYLVEVAEPMLDRIRGITDEELLMSGKDRFVMNAGEHKLLYAPIDENGWPVDKRTARHVTTLMTILEVHNMLTPDKAVILEGIPTYGEMMKKGIGAFFSNPDASPSERVFYD